MDPQDTHILSNDFQRVRLFRVVTHTAFDQASSAEVRGPYIILQKGIDPTDVTATSEEFILSRSGRWFPFHLFHQLPPQRRRGLFLYPNAAEAVSVLQQLPGSPIIERLVSSANDAAPGEPEDSHIHASACGVAGPFDAPAD
jgi:hypothetical protein